MLPGGLPARRQPYVHHLDYDSDLFVAPYTSMSLLDVKKLKESVGKGECAANGSARQLLCYLSLVACEVVALE